jgi:hypothetical protein
MKNILFSNNNDNFQTIDEIYKFILKISKSEECFILYNNVHEYEHSSIISDILFEIINEICERNKSKLYILHASPMQPFYTGIYSPGHSNHIYNLKNIKSLHWPTYYLHWVYNNIKETYKDYDVETVSVEKNFEKLYINYNHRDHYHRCLMMDDLVKFNLFDYGINTWIYTNGEHSGEYNFKYWKPEILKFDNFQKNRFIDDNGNILVHNNLFTDELLKPNSFLNLVTESNTDVMFLSEKTWKPILLEQPFIILGCPNQNLELLKYGFKLYDEIFDYSFDSEEDLQLRVLGIIHNLNKIKNKDYNELYNLIEEKIKFNKNRALEIIKNYEYFPKKLIDIVTDIDNPKYQETGEPDIDNFLKFKFKFEMQTDNIKKKYINLLFDMWDGDVHIPNGKSIFKDGFFFDSVGFFQWVLNSKTNPNHEFHIKTFDINNTNFDTDKIFIYPVSSPQMAFKDLIYHENKFFITDDVIQIIKNNKNIYFMFLMEHESATEREILEFKKICENKGLPIDRCYYINNNSFSDYLSKKHNLNIIKTNMIEYTSTDRLSDVKDVNFVENKNGKFFMCRNRNNRSHRASLILHLIINNIIDDVNYSFLYPPNEGETNPYELTLTNEEILLYQTEINMINGKPKEDDYEINYFDFTNRSFYRDKVEQISNRLDYPEMKNIYENSYVNIVTETHFEYETFNNVHITEKSFRPFYYYQIPIILASPYHIRFIREKYNFDFFDDIIDHSYDLELNHKTRFYMILDEIKKLHKNKEHIKEFYKNNRHRFEENKNKLLDVALNNPKDFDFFWNLV